jgi:hypothetical protein
LEHFIVIQADERFALGAIPALIGLDSLTPLVFLRKAPALHPWPTARPLSEEAPLDSDLVEIVSTGKPAGTQIDP